MHKIILALIFLFFVDSVFATQMKGVVDNETTAAEVSSLDVTRIVVEGDRIKSLKGVKGAYTRENDDKSGEVYLQPSGLYQNQAFTILIETEKGRHFTLLLTPVAVPGGTLLLVPKGVGREAAYHFERSSDYHTTISHLIRAMATDTIPEGYSVSEVNDKTIYHLGNSLTLHLITIYHGLHFQGEIYELTNLKSCAISLDERQFFKRGVSAVSLENSIVPPHGKIKLLRVISYA